MKPVLFVQINTNNIIKINKKKREKVIVLTLTAFKTLY